MIASDISMNDEKAATASIGEFGVLSAILGSIRRSNAPDKEELQFDVGGLITTHSNRRRICAGCHSTANRR